MKAARELLASGELRRIAKAHALTEPAVTAISDIVHEAARTRTRHLVLVTGVPGAGKTLVGLQAVHAHYLDDLSIDRGNGKPTAPAVFLSGNGPLVQVLQYEMKDAGGGGRVFVRDVKNYVKTYSRNEKRVPPEHVLVYDEAQRAFDAAMVAVTHKDDSGSHQKSEPELFVEFANRVPEWCVVIGLIGTGQEIHVGEEGGNCAVAPRRGEQPTLARMARAHATRVHHRVRQHRRARAQRAGAEPRHGTAPAHRERPAWLCGGPARARSPPVNWRGWRTIWSGTVSISASRATCTLQRRTCATATRRTRMHASGCVASARDKALPAFGVDNDFQSTKRTKFGPWYGDGDESPLSCRRLTECVTEFGAQGLELDAALLAWGTDFRLVNGGGRTRMPRATSARSWCVTRINFALMPTACC